MICLSITTDINECAPNGGLGPCDQFCTNTNGSFFCSCSPGYMHILSQYSCTGKKLHSLSIGTHSDAHPVLLIIKVIINNFLIVDINECAPNGGRGPCDQICTNTNGSFYCSCQPGYNSSGYSCSGKWSYKAIICIIGLPAAGFFFFTMLYMFLCCVVVIFSNRLSKSCFEHFLYWLCCL